jgi:hypothetical protein
MPLSSCEFYENLCSESHFLVKAVYKIFPVCSTFFIRLDNI